MVINYVRTAATYAMNIKNKNRWALYGSLTLILGGIGHLFIVDLAVLILKTDYVRVIPGSFLSQMKGSVFNFNWLGKNNVLNIFAGCSLWVVFSLILIGLHTMLIFRHIPAGHKLRIQSLILCLVLSLIFLVISVICFIYPPVVGSILAIVFFGLAIKKERNFSIF
jgi:hypothetical protein